MLLPAACIGAYTCCIVSGELGFCIVVVCGPGTLIPPPIGLSGVRPPSAYSRRGWKGLTPPPYSCFHLEALCAKLAIARTCGSLECIASSVVLPVLFLYSVNFPICDFFICIPPLANSG